MPYTVSSKLPAISSVKSLLYNSIVLSIIDLVFVLVVSLKLLEIEILELDKIIV